jgi:S1-C subfamily serine protease
MSQSLYPAVTREHSPPPHRESGLTKILAILLLVVAGALVFTVYQQKKHGSMPAQVFEPKPIAQRPDDKLGADEQNTIDVFEKFNRSVVHVTNIASRQNQFTLDPTDIDQATGTGFVWDAEGHIVTNFHVVAGADKARVTLDDGESYPATIIGLAPDKDIAVLKIDAPASKLLPLPVGESSHLKVGQKVLAIGNPFGYDHTLTTGVISGLGREIKSMSGRPISDVIQTDASINPGNSGGPLLDSSGRLIGINTMIYSPSGASAGIGFAVPVDTVNRIVPGLIKDGKIARPGLGIVPLPDHVAVRYKVQGVAILQVAPGGSADRAGLQGARSNGWGQQEIVDVITGVDGVDTKTLNDLYKALDRHKVGDEVEVRVLRGGANKTVKVTLQEVQ